MSVYVLVFFFNQKTADEMRISDWSSDVCSSDLPCAMLEGSRDSRGDPMRVMDLYPAVPAWPSRQEFPQVPVSSVRCREYRRVPRQSFSTWRRHRRSR